MRPDRPDSRVLVFVDGQNVFKRCKALYDHGRCHPLLLAHRLAAGRRLVGVRYYSGVHAGPLDPVERDEFLERCRDLWTPIEETAGVAP